MSTRREGVTPLSGAAVVGQTHSDVTIGRCVGSERNLACAVLVRHEIPSDDTVSLSTVKATVCFAPLWKDNAGEWIGVFSGYMKTNTPCNDLNDNCGYL